jgi:DNA-directed RNA polymerase specialized sigma24 family protein
VDHAELVAELASQDWKGLFPQLTAYTVSRAKRYRWARGGLNLPNGNDPQDVVEHVITKLFSGEHHWNREKHLRLFDHLTSRIDSVLYALARSPANRLQVAVMDDGDLDRLGAATDPRDESAKEHSAWVEEFWKSVDVATGDDGELRQLGELLRDGLKPREIAARLGVNVTKVYTLERKLMRRLERIHGKDRNPGSKTPQ